MKFMNFSFKCQMVHLNRCQTFRAGYHIHLLLELCLKRNSDSLFYSSILWCLVFLCTISPDRCFEGNWVHWWRPRRSNERPCSLWDEFWGGIDMYWMLVWEPTGWSGTRRSSGVNVSFCVPAEEYVWAFTHTQAGWSET